MNTFPFKKALVTGGAGFIGSHIVEELVKLGVETISIDDYFAGKQENLAHLKGYSNFRQIKCDGLVKSQTPSTQLPCAYAHNCVKKALKNFPIDARLSKNVL